MDALTKAREALVPFALLGSECFDTNFTISLQGKQGESLVLLTQDHFRKAFEVYSSLEETGAPISPASRPEPPKQDLFPWLTFGAGVFFALGSVIFSICQ